MLNIILFFIIASLLSICYQDFKSREVRLITYLVLYMLYAILIISGEFIDRAANIVLNTCIVLVVITMLLIYYLLRYRAKTFQRLKSSIGMGDVMIIPVFIISFSPSNFIVVYMFSLILSLFYSLVINLFQKAITIPLAGIQAILLAVCHIIHVSGLINMQHDFYPLL